MRFDHIVKNLEYGIDHINKPVSKDDTVKNVLIDPTHNNIGIGNLSEERSLSLNIN